MLLAPGTSQSTANQLLRSGNCSILLFASEYRQKAEQIAESQENLRAWEVMDLWKWFDSPSTPKTVSSYCREYTRAKEEETAIILYSSGTTGRIHQPKSSNTITDLKLSRSFRVTKGDSFASRILLCFGLFPTPSTA